MPINYNIIKEVVKKISGCEELSDVESLDKDLEMDESGSTDLGLERNHGPW